MLIVATYLTSGVVTKYCNNTQNIQNEVLYAVNGKLPTCYLESQDKNRRHRRQSRR